MNRTINSVLSRSLLGTLAVGSLLLFADVASADTETWDFDLETSGENVFYTSPTATCTVAPEYHGAYAITLLEVTVSYSGFTFGPFDVTNEIPPELRTGEDVYAGPPPFVVMDEYICYPDPPEPATVAADVLMNVDANGYGHVSVTNVVLGTAVYDLGWPFGEVEVQIETVRVAGTVWVTPLVPGDLDGDGDVDLADLAQLLGHYGMPNGATYEDGDLDGDGDVDLADLAFLLSNYGLSC
ncbi:MAG: hypothetical protein KKI02_04040 [Planctomycetes bacterium]|nr:hypothetical protein [Planctomycetota bacterium]